MYVSPVGYLLQVTRTANTEPGADKAMVFTNVALRHRGCISAQPPVKPCIHHLPRTSLVTS